MYFSVHSTKVLLSTFWVLLSVDWALLSVFEYVYMYTQQKPKCTFEYKTITLMHSKEPEIYKIAVLFPWQKNF